MFCGKCGNELPDGAKFCGNCGTSQNLPTAESLPEAVPVNVQTGGKQKKSIFEIIIAIFVLAVIILGVKTVIGLVNENWDKLHGSKGQMLTDFDTFVKPAIEISQINFDTSMSGVSFSFDNISDKDISYITFETYFYDRMGGALSVDMFGEEYALDLSYTEPLYFGGSDEVYWSYLFSMPDGTAVVYPKNITVTFFDDTEITFENTVYAHTSDFYGGELKDKK